jgi:bacteriorhodopsin
MYLAMATGYAVSLVPLQGGGEVHMFWGRYVDWLITTPLLLFELALFADADRDVIATLVGLDAFMIATGLIAGFTKVPAYRYLWWIVSTGAFLVVLYGIVSTLTDSAQGLSPTARDDFGTLRNLLAGV